MKKNFGIFATTILITTTAFAGLPEALMSLNYQQYNQAYNEFSQLAAEGNAASLFYLGRMYQNGWGVAKNIPQAVNYFQMADKKFYLPASAQLGKILLYGTNGVTAQPARAVMLLKKAALAGDADAALELGNAAVSGLGGEPNFNHAYGYYLIAALKGDSKAQFQVSQMYLLGRGIPQNFTKAIQWMRRSANQGYVRAQVELADLAENNPKLKDLGEAYAWNAILAAYNSDAIGTTAARKRDELAQKINIKNLNEWQARIRTWNPKTPEQSVPAEERQKTVMPTIPNFNDPKTLQQILLQEGALPMDASSFGLTAEMIDIAEATGDRLSLTTQIEKALKRDKLSAAAYYGDLLRTRLHEPEEAILWYQKGADAGDAYAQYQLAKAYCEGNNPDIGKCYGWLLVTKETLDPVLNELVAQALLTVRANATPDELERGQAQADSILKKEEHEKKEKSILNFF